MFLEKVFLETGRRRLDRRTVHPRSGLASGAPVFGMEVLGYVGARGVTLQPHSSPAAPRCWRSPSLLRCAFELLGHFSRGFFAEAKLSVSVTGLLSMSKALAPSAQITAAAVATLLKAALCCKSSPWHRVGGSCPRSKRRKNRRGVEAAEPDSFCSGMTASLGGVERMRTGMNFLQEGGGKALGMVARMAFSKQLGVSELLHMPYYPCWASSNFLFRFNFWPQNIIVKMLLSDSGHFNTIPKHFPTTQRPLNASSSLQKPCAQWLSGF